MVIESVEISSNSLAKCKGCKNRINKGYIRGYENKKYKIYNSYSFFCLNCVKEKLKEELENIKEIQSKIVELQNG